MKYSSKQLKLLALSFLLFVNSNAQILSPSAETTKNQDCDEEELCEILGTLHLIIEDLVEAAEDFAKAEDIAASTIGDCNKDHLLMIPKVISKTVGTKEMRGEFRKIFQDAITKPQLIKAILLTPYKFANDEEESQSLLHRASYDDSCSDIIGFMLIQLKLHYKSLLKKVLEKTDAYGCTPLDIAEEFQASEVVKILKHYEKILKK